MNLLIKFSGEFFESKDDLTQQGKDFLDCLSKEDNAYIVIGGGNRIRGRDSNYCRNASDNIGVISTLMNGYILKENMIQRKFKVKLFSHFQDFGTYYTPKDAIRAHEKGNWVILASGLGRVGYVSTDLSSVIKALETKADAVIKITQSDGIYDKDPKYPDAKFIENISHAEVLTKQLAVMDAAAVAIASEHDLPIAILNIKDFDRFMKGEKVGSIIGIDWRKA